jgi:hypothetical protein
MATPIIATVRSPSDPLTLVVKRLESLPPIISFAVAFVFGLVLLLASFVSDLNFVVDPTTQKTYGYIYEINWGLNFVVFVPVALYFATATLNSIHQTIIRVADSRMILTEAGKPLDRLELRVKWHAYARRAIRTWLALSVIVVLAVVAEWWRSCIWPLHLNFSLLSPIKSPVPGWNIAPHLSGQQIGPVATVLFGAFAYLGEAALVMCFLLFISVVFAFAAWIFGFTNEDVPLELFPNPRSEDPRRGFESFQLFIENLLLAATAFFFVFFMTRLQYAFLDSTSSKTVMDFVSSDIWMGFFKGLKALKDASPDLFATGKHLWYSTAMTGAATALTLITSFLIPGTIVRQAALRARDRFLDWCPQHGSEVQSVYGMEPQQAAERVATIVHWPISYPGPIQLLLFVVLAAGCFVFYKLTLVLAGVILYAGFKQLVKVFTAQSKTP